jgi:TRAP-type mannitol/chloroaromatic compound transport system permease small subunit
MVVDKGPLVLSSRWNVRSRSMLEKISSAIDTFNRKQGEWSALLILPLTFIVVYEVIMRYVFDAPTIWGFEATTFLYGVHFMLGRAFTDVSDGHVKVDIFTAKARSRTQAIIVILTNLVIFLPVFSCMTIWAWKYAITSTQLLERNSTSWAPPIWPFKLIMAVSFSFLLVQGISTVLKAIHSLRTEK